MIRQALTRFMSGRYGMDQLNHTMMALYILLWIVYLFSGWLVLQVLSLALLIATLFRMMSRRLDLRRAENTKFLQLTRPLTRKVKNTTVRMRDREHRYFKCPGCGQRMRVPRGKGRITVRCRSCGTTFEEKS